MVKKEEVERLAELARLTVTPEEAEQFATQMSDILSYIEKVREVGACTSDIPLHRNVFREDGVPDEAGLYTKELLDTAPQKKDNSILVPRIISND